MLTLQLFLEYHEFSLGLSHIVSLNASYLQISSQTEYTPSTHSPENTKNKGLEKHTFLKKVSCVVDSQTIPFSISIFYFLFQFFLELYTRESLNLVLGLNAFHDPS